MISVLQAQAMIEETIDQRGLPESETVPLAQVHGRILREAGAAAEDIPAFDRSAMDGYAIRADDAGDEFDVVDEIRAGQSFDRQVRPGETIRIFTGGRMPGPGLKVVLQEHVEVREKRIRILKRSPASNVRLRGEDARAGESLLAPGITLDATAVALLASIGKTVVQVSRRPTILHLTTGDEIVSPERTPGPGQIRNSNAPLIASLLAEQGLTAVDHFHAGDDLAAMIKILDGARASSYDLVLISGGSGPGNYDFSAALFRHLGATIHFREVNVRPGKPLMFGSSSTQTIFGLPGNALSHFVCFHLFVRRALDRVLCRSTPPVTRGFLAEAMNDTANARETWWPACANLADGRLELRALPWKSSGDITRLPAANSLIRVPSSTPSLPKESIVEVLPTRNLF